MDKRKQNGGNSTKAKRSDDKRLKSNKNLLEDYIAENVTPEKLSKLFEAHYKLAVEGDSRSAAIYLNYVLGKPKETKDIKLEVDNNFPSWLHE